MTFSTGTIVAGITAGIIMGILHGIYITYHGLSQSNVIGKEKDNNIKELNEKVVFHEKR